jgi:16S rRNA (uracil1498-N3)-methyltransferase
MRISRLYVNKTLQPEQTVELDDENGHYVRTVLRLSKSNPLTLFNGNGSDYQAELIEVSRKQVKVFVKAQFERSAESPLTINLGLGISRGDRMDWSVQKAVELGVNRITPLITERCVIQFNPEKKLQRLAHWRKIIQHAAEQSGRNILPELGEVTVFPDWVQSQSGLKVFLDPYAELSLAALSQPGDMNVSLLTGPEGGFSDKERTFAKTAEFTPVRLGSRILRTETASIAALAAVQMLWGDFRA